MKIVYLHQYFVTPEQPGGTRSFEMARRLVAAGHQVEMITSDQNAKMGEDGWRVSDEAGITVHWKSQPYSNAMGFFARLKAFVAFAFASSQRAASIRDADVIFATSTPLTIAIPAMYASFRTKTPYVFEVRDVWPAVPIALGALRNPVLKWLARRLEYAAYHRAAHVVALAPGMGDEVASTGYPHENITIIPNGCDTDIFGAATTPGTLDDYETWLGNRPLVLFAGTLGKANNVGYVADIAKAMLDRDPDVLFAIIGAGAEREAIAKHARNLGVLDRNLKMVPAVPKRILSSWIQRASLCLALFSGPRILWKDSVQNKFFDALAAGKPVISNQHGWQCKIAQEHDVGALMPDSDPNAAADVILRFVRDPHWLSSAEARAKELAKGEFSRDSLAAILERCLRRVVDEAQVRKAG